MTTKDYLYYKKAFRGIGMPFAFVDLDYFEENIRQIEKRANGKKVRIASKSLRCPELMKYILNSSPAFEGLMCFTAAEALYLSQQGFNNLLVAYPSVDRGAIQGLAQEIQRGQEIYLMVDSLEQAHLLDQIGRNQNVILKLCLDVDMSTNFPGLHFGVWRSGLTSISQVIALVRQLQSLRYVKLEAFMGYEAQIAGVADQVPKQQIKSHIIRFLKKKSYQELAQRRAEIVKAIQEEGIDLKVINGGGTGSLELTASETCLTEVTAGSGFYASALFDDYSAFQHLPAAGFAIPIVRQPAPQIYTCLGGGYIASGGAGKDKLPKVYLPQGANLFELEGAGEVQTPIHYKGSIDLRFGDPIFMRHSKAGELCERFNSLLLLKEGKIVQEVKTYRGEGYSFL